MLNSGSLGKASIVLAVLIFLFPSSFYASDTATSARKVVEKSSSAVATIKVFIKQRVIFGGRDMDKYENVFEMPSTVIAPSGLAVTSLSRMDPTGTFKELLKQVPGAQANTGFDIASEITGIKMVLYDGQEVPAEIVMRDSDLDLVFISPTEKLTVPFIDLSDATTPKILEEVIVLGRLEHVPGRITSAALYRVEAVIEKPRVIYVLNSEALTSRLGSPVFSENGKIVGVLVLKVVKTQTQGFNIMSGMPGMMAVIMPAGDILQTAEQIHAAPK